MSDLWVGIGGATGGFIMGFVGALRAIKRSNGNGLKGSQGREQIVRLSEGDKQVLAAMERHMEAHNASTERLEVAIQDLRHDVQALWRDVLKGRS